MGFRLYFFYDNSKEFRDRYYVLAEFGDTFFERAMQIKPGHLHYGLVSKLIRKEKVRQHPNVQIWGNIQASLRTGAPHRLREGEELIVEGVQLGIIEKIVSVE